MNTPPNTFCDTRTWRTEVINISVQWQTTAELQTVESEPFCKTKKGILWKVLSPWLVTAARSLILFFKKYWVENPEGDHCCSMHVIDTAALTLWFYLQPSRKRRLSPELYHFTSRLTDNEVDTAVQGETAKCGILLTPHTCRLPRHVWHIFSNFLSFQLSLILLSFPRTSLPLALSPPSVSIAEPTETSPSAVVEAEAPGTTLLARLLIY